jgi:hypothetical protein
LARYAAPITELIAAAAAYELAFHFAGADKDEPADYRLAAEWARKSVAYLQSTNDVQLLKKTELAALQLEYYAAGDTSRAAQNRGCSRLLCPSQLSAEQGRRDLRPVLRSSWKSRARSC